MSTWTGDYPINPGVGTSDGTPCSHCGYFHMGPCPRIKSIEYFPNGTIKRIDYHESKTGLENIKT